MSGFGYTPEQEAVRSAMESFAGKHVAPLAASIDESGEFPADLVRQMHQTGVVGTCLPEEFGGAGGDHLMLLLAIEELAVASAAVANIAMVQACYAELLWRYADPEMAAELLPAVVAGDRLLAVAMTEPNAGSDVAAIRTKAIRNGDHYVLDGQKQFITMAEVCDAAVVFAKTGTGGHDDVTAFLVPTTAPGVERSGHDDLLGMRGQATGTLYFDGVRVPVSARLGAEGEGFGVAMRSFELGRLVIGTMAVGIARAATEAAASYAVRREAFGRPIGDFQGVAFPIADMHARTVAARLVLHSGAAKLDAGEDFAMEASIGKLLASDLAMDAASDAVLLHGGLGYSRELPVQRYFRDAKLTQIYEGTNHIQRHIIARQILRSRKSAVA